MDKKLCCKGPMVNEIGLSLRGALRRSIGYVTHLKLSNSADVGGTGSRVMVYYAKDTLGLNTSAIPFVLVAWFEL
jgi:hypothetical protein